ncbi:hypothetical protein [Salinibacter ruber]|uniref:hypothetical protein n=1 Tax=Salinibacter ruber TaxID=146919 RepID=UPI002169B471|nr:hypothetical protein [Salinibacter ruber]MCS4041335.1 hypothetical protein [Salinibacter ruber]
MDASPLFDPEYLPIIAGTLIGFALLAALLLVPIWRFLDREEEVAEEWTPEAVAERMREHKASTNAPESVEETDPSPEQGEAAPRPPGS